MRSTLLILLAGALVAALYAPALNRVFAADQIWYMAETSRMETFSEKLTLVDYELTRQYWRGEEKLYRPLLFVLLAVERQIFGTDHRLWNLASLLFHLLATYLLYRLLAKIHNREIAGALALMFGAMKSNAELVTWHHLGGYILAYACFLMAWDCALGMFDEEIPLARIKYLAASSLAVFLYEPAAIFFLLITIVAVASAFMRQRAKIRIALKPMCVLLAPVVLFSAAYGLHVLRADRFFGGAVAGHPDAVTLTALPAAIAVMASSLAVAGLLPAAVNIEIEPFQRFEIAYPGASLSASFLINAVLVIAMIVIIAPALGRVVTDSAIRCAGMRGRRREIALTSAGMIVSYLAIIAIGRTVDNARENTYYAYLFNIFALVGASALVDPDRLSAARKKMALAVMICFAVLQGGLLSDVTLKIRDANMQADLYYYELGNFVQAHRAEPDFSFRMDGALHLELDPPFELARGYFYDPAAEKEQKNLSRILYEPWWRSEEARYALTWSQDRLEVSRN